MAASGSCPAPSDEACPPTANPDSMSQVASDQLSCRQSWAISARASWCSWDSIQMPVKQARTYSDKRSASDIDFPCRWMKIKIAQQETEWANPGVQRIVTCCR